MAAVFAMLVVFVALLAHCFALVPRESVVVVCGVFIVRRFTLARASIVRVLFHSLKNAAD